MRGLGASLALTLAVLGCGAEVESRAQSDGVRPQTLVSGQQRPWALALDENQVYFTADRAPGWLRGVPKRGGAAADLATLESGQQEQVGLLAGTLYFWETSHRLSRVLVSGGASSQLSSRSTEVIVKSGAMTTHERVFWVEEEIGFAGSYLTSVPVEGGAPVRAAFPARPGPAGVPPFNLRVAEDRIYVGATNSGGVDVFPVDGTEPTTISTGSVPSTLGAIDDSFLYLATDDAVISVTRQGGAPEQIISGLHRPAGVAMDDANVFVAENVAGGRILKVPKRGGQPSVLASGQGSARAIVLDQTNIYWSCIDEGAIKTLAK
jgi:hypothetical protein